MAFSRLYDRPYGFGAGDGFDSYSFDGENAWTPPGDYNPGPLGGGTTNVPLVTEDSGKPPTATTGYDPVGGGPEFNFPNVPPFVAPKFTAPTFDEAQNEPGYQFRLKAGSDALERSAAARGVLRTGGTLKDIMEYGQKFGSQEYGNVYDRALRTWGARYQAAKDEYAPSMAMWQLRGQGALQGGLAKFNAQQKKYEIDSRNSGGGGGSTGNLSDIFNEPPPEFPGFNDWQGYW